MQSISQMFSIPHSVFIQWQDIFSWRHVASSVGEGAGMHPVHLHRRHPGLQKNHVSQPVPLPASHEGSREMLQDVSRYTHTLTHTLPELKHYHRHDPTHLCHLPLVNKVQNNQTHCHLGYKNNILVYKVESSVNVDAPGTVRIITVERQSTAEVEVQVWKTVEGKAKIDINFGICGTSI